MALEYMFAPVDVTVVVAVECTVYGPRTEPAGPLRWSGVMVRLGGGGWVKRSFADDIVHDRGDSALDRLGGAEHIAVAEEPDGGLNRGRPLIDVRQRTGLVCVRVVLVEDAGHVPYVRDVRLVPGTQGVAVADVGVSVDVDAVEVHLAPPPTGVP